MTEVLSIRANGISHYGAPLRRTSSHSSFPVQTPAAYTRSSSDLRARYSGPTHPSAQLPPSLSSSAPSSPPLTAPGFSNQPSYASTPSSSLSLDEQCNVQEGIVFPTYGDFDDLKEYTPEDPCIGAVPPTPSENSSAPPPSSSQSEPVQVGGDDTNIKCEPTRHVDYLSHTWKEEDIWASWRHIVGRRKDYTNSPRLENAAWRTWAKTMWKLRTISPEALNWMKDHDVTWLYGPLQIGKAKSLDMESPPAANALSRTNSFASKKPILKKRSLSEIMLQRSLSSSTLMKQVTDAVRAQHVVKRGRTRPQLGNRALSDFAASSAPGTPLTRIETDQTSTEPSSSTSGLETPCTKRHIHFNDKVEQCIAINNVEYIQSSCYHTFPDDSETSSEDEMLVMKPAARPTKAKISNRSSPRDSFSSEGKTIAMLPSTTLNYRGDTPEPQEQTKQMEDGWGAASSLAQSSSQQTLRPSMPSANFLMNDEDDDVDINWQPSAGRRGSIYPRDEVAMSPTDELDEAEAQGLRRTPSGMFMPYDDEEDYINAGLLGKVVDTVNTAKDIAHVIWNVGWRS